MAYGCIAYGIVYEEGTQFPWDEPPYDGEIDDWWRSVNGYGPIYRPFTEEGNWAEGWQEGDSRLKEYYAYRREWEAQNPLPIDLFDYYGYGEVMYALVLPDHSIKFKWGKPAAFVPSNLTVDVQALARFLEFLDKYGIPKPSELQWLAMVNNID